MTQEKHTSDLFDFSDLLKSDEELRQEELEKVLQIENTSVWPTTLCEKLSAEITSPDLIEQYFKAITSVHIISNTESDLIFAYYRDGKSYKLLADDKNDALTVKRQLEKALCKVAFSEAEILFATGNFRLFFNQFAHNISKQISIRRNLAKEINGLADKDYSLLNSLNKIQYEFLPDEDE